LKNCIKRAKMIYKSELPLKFTLQMLKKKMVSKKFL